MDGISIDVIQLLKYLLPGFLTAWIFYGLTAYRRPAQFERIVQALVFTGIIQIATIIVRWALQLFGLLVSIGEWTDESQFIWSWLIAIILGVGFSWCGNRNWLHEKLRNWKLTANTSYPSQWYSAFKEVETDIILNFKNKRRRLQGWLFEWPNQPDDGQFRLTHAIWLTASGKRIELDRAECVVIPAADVAFVEFIKCPSEDADEKRNTELQPGKLRNEPPTTTYAPTNTATPSTTDTRPREDGAPPREAKRSANSAPTKKKAVARRTPGKNRETRKE